jgi:dissimilatory sulfite reductase related protein
MLAHPVPTPANVPPHWFEGRHTLFDTDRFLVDHEQWNEPLAERIAQWEGVGPLSESHWRVVRHVRARFLALGGMPSMRRVCRATGLSREEIHGLFGGCLPVWRIAGLPNPGEEAKAYL